VSKAELDALEMAGDVRAARQVRAERVAERPERKYRCDRRPQQSAKRMPIHNAPRDDRSRRALIGDNHRADGRFQLGTTRLLRAAGTVAPGARHFTGDLANRGQRRPVRRAVQLQRCVGDRPSTRPAAVGGTLQADLESRCRRPAVGRSEATAATDTAVSTPPLLHLERSLPVLSKVVNPPTRMLNRLAVEELCTSV
jgi:hypothetical protein